MIKVFSYLLTKFVRVNDNIIVFESFIGRQFSDNPRAIYEYIQQMHPEYQCYWSVEKKKADDFSKLGLRTIKKGTITWFVTMAKAKYWVANSRIPLWTVKPKRTIFVQTWHGTPLKKLALDMDMSQSKLNKSKRYQAEFVIESDRWDFLVSPNRYSSEIFTRCFAFKNHMIETGYPRNDFLINNKENTTLKDSIRKKLGIPAGKKVILYTPTWRDSIHFDLKLDLQKMQAHFGDDYCVLIRFHYLVTQVSGVIPESDFVKNVSSYDEISELYLISELLVTDYSSTFFDYAVLDKPMFFYCPDLVEYKDVLRGFYFDFEKEAPGPIVNNTTELIQAIDDSDTFKLSPGFKKRFVALEDGKATERVVAQFLNKKV